MLPCQHTYHEHCLRQLLADSGRLICPECREVHFIDAVNNLRANIWINKTNANGECESIKRIFQIENVSFDIIFA